MARPLRIHIPGALYHVISRGNARQKIFLDDGDDAYFLSRLAATTSRFAVRCYAYCLMINHYHLLLEPGRLPVWRLMQQLNSSYSQRFNRRHQRVGHLLQGRYKAFIIDREHYFRRVLRYIVLNPVRARLATHPAEWRWSSYRATAGLEPPPTFLAADAVWKAFDADSTLARQAYVAFVASHPRTPLDAPTGPIVCGSDRFVARVGLEIEPHHADREIVYAERFACRPSLGELFAGSVDTQALDAAMWRAFARHGYTLREIGGVVGRPPATVWRRIRRAIDRQVVVNCHRNAKIEI